MDAAVVAERTAELWDREILPALERYITIPNQSPAFDPGWHTAGHMDRAVELVATFCRARAVQGATVDVVRLPDRPPVVVVEVPAFDGTAPLGADIPDARDTVLLYGHLDKQPPMLPWSEGLDPWHPVRRGDRLYGRGGADDGYAAFAALAALEATQAAGGRHGRCIVVIESEEESGSPGLPDYLELLAERLGPVGLVICLDSSCATFDRLWLTTSLRGLVGVELTIDVLTAGVHSGAAGGVVPSSFDVLRQLLDRVADSATGQVTVPALFGPVPPERQAQIAEAAAALGPVAGGTFPLVDGVRRLHDGDVAAQLRARTWEPALEVIGLDGVPAPEVAGNVLRPRTRAKLSFRLPPSVDAPTAAAALREVLAAEPPFGARVAVDVDDAATGWNAPPTAPWLAEALDHAAQVAFGQPVGAMGEGGTIPFMAMLGQRFPQAQFVITGVLGPGSNAHGPDEFLHLPTAVGVTVAVAHLLHAHASRP